VAWNQDVRDLVLETWPIGSTFTLGDVYGFEGELAAKYPGNKHVREKIRQSLQVRIEGATMNAVVPR